MSPQRSMLVATLLVSCGAPPGQPHADSVTLAPNEVVEFAALYTDNCAACHGVDGKGRGPAASALKTAPADLTTIAERNRGAFPRALIADFVANGKPTVAAHGSTDMPIWGPNFIALAGGSLRPVNERVDAVVSYVESLQTVRQ